jgi:hypothetical protein
VRRDAKFTRRDAAQLLNHEAFIHVATALNGQAQVDLPILALGHPGTTRTQEGLAVFSEFVSGTLDLDRLRRLAERVVAVQMVCEGADFITLYRWFLERSSSEEQAFESTRRIFRGAPLSGGAPFTKDCGYLSGLLAVLMFVRAAFACNRSDTLGLLFAGKLDLSAIPALADLRRRGLCRRALSAALGSRAGLGAELHHALDVPVAHRSDGGGRRCEGGPRRLSAARVRRRGALQRAELTGRGLILGSMGAGRGRAPDRSLFAQRGAADDLAQLEGFHAQLEAVLGDLEAFGHGRELAASGAGGLEDLIAAELFGFADALAALEASVEPGA